MDQLGAMRLFVRVVDSGGFSRVARAMGIAQPTVSKQIATLEERLGAQLLRRTPRTVTVTPAGREYYETVVQLLKELEAVESRVGRAHASPSGLLRVSLPAGVARLHIFPLLPAFLARYPDISIDIDVSDRYVNLLEDGFDLAVRVGELPDSASVARRIGASPRVTVATPAFLQRHGQPRTPTDLESFRCVAFTSQGTPRPWTFSGSKGRTVFRPQSRVRANDAEAVRALVLADLAIGHTASWLFAPELESGAVQRVLEDHVSDQAFITALYPGRRELTRKARVLVEFLAGAFAATPCFAPV